MFLVQNKQLLSTSRQISMTADASSSSLAGRLKNFFIVLVAVILSVTLFLGWRSQTSQVSLSSLSATAIPLEVAQQNTKPTLIEFYANWCSSCQAMVEDLDQLKQQYGDQVNFVMLNVDNSKWLPEVLRYGVDGIPHFIFLSASNQDQGSVIGKQPLPIMAANLQALIAAQPLPHLQPSGQISNFAPPVRPNSDDPRSHGGMATDPA